MADNDQPAQKRRLRPISNDTVRERAVKAQIAAGVVKPRKVRGALGKGLSPLRLLGRFLGGLGKFIVPAYFRNSWKELRQVTWPSRKQSRQLTFAVLLFAIVFGILVASVDWGLDKVFKHVLLK